MLRDTFSNEFNLKPRGSTSKVLNSRAMLEQLKLSKKSPNKRDSLLVQQRASRLNASIKIKTENAFFRGGKEARKRQQQQVSDNTTLEDAHLDGNSASKQGSLVVSDLTGQVPQTLTNEKVRHADPKAASVE